MRTDLFDYDLPDELIAQTPLERGESRLLVVHRSTASFEHRRIADLPEYLEPGDTLVVNDTRVSGRRIEARRENGLSAEVLLISPVRENGWHALVKPGRALRPGKTATLIGPDLTVLAAVTAETADGGRIIELPDAAWRDEIATWGHTPLPPYIHHHLSKSEEERYQTVYNRQPGSVAAPTAGLHFTQRLLDRIDDLGVRRVSITLNVGVGTFRPVRTEEISSHEMHGEEVTISRESADAVNCTSGRVVALGTTTVRALESAVNPQINPAASHDVETIGPGSGPRCLPFHGLSSLFITPGYRFRAVDALLTNFHQPKSTLLMMVCAFSGYELIRAAYNEAIRERYRFFSFGDAMLIL